jgi:hypothetical protein
MKRIIVTLVLSAAGVWAITGWNDPVTVAPQSVVSPRLSAGPDGCSTAWISGGAVLIREPSGRTWTVAIPAGSQPEFDFQRTADGRYRGLIVSSSNLYRFMLDPATGIARVTNLETARVHSPRVFGGAGRIVESFNTVSEGRHTLLFNADLDGFAPAALASGGASDLGSFFPECLVTSNQLRVVFMRRTATENSRLDSVWMTTSVDGSVWTPPVRLGTPGKSGQEPSLSCENRRILISFSEWSSNRAFSLTVMHSTNAGASFATTVSTDFPLPLYRPSVLPAPEGWSLAAYDRFYNGRSSILVRQGRTDGSWGRIIRLSSSNDQALSLISSAFGKNVYLGWLEGTAFKLTENDSTAEPPIVSSPDLFPGFDNGFANPLIIWTAAPDPSGIQSFAYLLDAVPDSEPDIPNLDGTVRERSFSGLSDGPWYFHIRTIDGNGNWSKTTHFAFTIDTRPLATPVISSTTHPAFTPVPNDRPVFSWKMPDSNRKKILGYSTLLTKYANLEPDERIQTFSTSLPMPRVEPGVWNFMVKACDVHSNWSGYSTYTINVETPSAPPPLETAAGPTNKGVFTYVIKRGDILSQVIQKVLGLRNNDDFKSYLKEVARFNGMADVDQVRPNDQIRFPVIVADRDTDTETLARDIWGNARFKDRITLPGRTNIESVRSGDIVLLRDPRFIRTGEIKSEWSAGQSGQRPLGVQENADFKSKSLPSVLILPDAPDSIPLENLIITNRMYYTNTAQ